MRFMKKFFLLGFMILIGSLTQAQNSFTVSGKIVDTSGVGLDATTAVLLNASDSVLYLFTISDKDGNFYFDKVQKDNYILQLSYMGYKAFSKNISIPADLLLGTLSLRSENFRLATVDVAGDRIPIVFKDDTIEYNADAFKTTANAPVEDLLKKLPGMEVERDGSVKAQGEDVQRVLVDGKEFFGDDPKMATKNLPANAIDKVQVYDKMSDMAEFSGIDDGERLKTINLTLKEDKKKGQFGSFTAGYGSDDRYEGKFNVNRFSEKLQLSAVGMANNINEQGFSVDDYISFMGGFQNMFRGGNSFRSSGLPLGNGNSQGITETWAGGLNLNSDFSKKTRLNTSYIFNRMQQETLLDTERKNVTDGRTFDTDEDSEENSDNLSHKVTLRFEHEFDSTQNLIITGGLNANDAELASILNSSTQGGRDFLERSTLTDNSGTGDGLNYNTKLLYKKKFNTEGRNLVLSGNIMRNTQNFDAALNVFNELVLMPIPQPQLLLDTTLQNQISKNTTERYGGELRYTEPLGKNWYLSAKYDLSLTDRENQKNFFDLNRISDANPILNDSLSNGFTSRFMYHNAGLTIQKSNSKYNVTLGLSAQNSTLDGVLSLDGSEPIDKTFFNLLPSLNASYRFSRSKRISLRYNTNINAPSVQQLQPVIDNSDPFNLYQGNPNLDAEYRHTANIHWMSFSQFSMSSFFANLRATYTEDIITNKVEVDSFFARMLTPINVKNDLNLSSYMAYSTPIRALGIKTRISTNISYNKAIQFVNSSENNLDRWTKGVDLKIENRDKKWIDIVGGVKLSETTTDYDINKELNSSFLTTTYYADLSLDFWDTWNIQSQFDYMIYGGEAFTGQISVPLLQASISKTFLKDNRGQLKLSAYDLLDENTGVSRSTDLNYVTEERYNTLTQYYMLSIIYSIKGFDKGKSGGMKFMMRH